MNSIINKQAAFDYEILEKYQAGLVLTGAEVKSVKAGQMNLKGAYITIKHLPKPELYLTNAHISHYKPAGTKLSYDPTAPRKLLVTKQELNSLIGKLEQKGLTIVPLKVYTIRNLVKVEFGLAKGKKKFEKKEDIKKKDLQRDIRRTFKINLN